MLNESTISQARNAILSRNETVAKAFVNRTEDGIFMDVQIVEVLTSKGADGHRHQQAFTDGFNVKCVERGIKENISERQLNFTGKNTGKIYDKTVIKTAVSML